MNISKFTWQNILDSIPDSVCVLDEHHKIVWLNKQMATVLGRSKEQCLNKYCYDLVHETNRPPGYCPFSKFLADGKTHSVEASISLLCKEFWVSVSTIKDESGELLGAIHLARDITKIKNQQRELLTSESKLAAAFSSSPIAMCITRLSDGLIMEVNKAWFTVTGYARDESIGVHVQRLNVYNEITDREKIIRTIEKDGRLDNFDITLRHKSGQIFYGQMSTSVVNIGNDECAISAFVDKTKEVELAKALKDVETQLLEEARDNLITSLDSGVLVK
jgi:PAS domain S-box-containing protein